MILAAVSSLLLLVSCGWQQVRRDVSPLKHSVTPTVAVYGDSVLAMARDADAVPADITQAWPGTAPVNWRPKEDRVAWVFVGSNVGTGLEGPADDVEHIVNECKESACLLITHGIVEEFELLVAETGLPSCALPEVDRPDGVHPDAPGVRVVGAAVVRCLQERGWIK